MSVIPIQTERLILRDFEETDWKSVHSYGSDPEVVRYLPFGPNSEEDTKNFLQLVGKLQQKHPRLDYQLAIILKAENQLIGGCRLSISSTDDWKGSIGYCLNRDFWGQGYATEAAQALLDFGFQQLGLHRIFGLSDPENIGSVRVLEKIGMGYEGHLRENQWIKGKWRDTLLFTILEQQWNQLKADNMNQLIPQKGCNTNSPKVGNR